ncbi:MAG: hypothetical protein QF903_00560 [Planctomycetota bacterium]|nr:hypothetical protein [Planctomycetota bacterium]MDP6761879.1 hypothetical protein [Planctomycetota bacterium]MDP6987951.1 hypothetical protein [Planctomycetota bacterium]
MDTTDAPEEPQANPLTWEWERVEARLFRSMRAEPDPDADRRFVRSMMDWPEELNAENSAEHLGGVTLSEEQAAHLERSVRTLNAELESHAWIYADSLNRIRRANYDAGDYAATPVEPGAPWPKVPWNRSSGKYPGWLVTWPAITFEDHPELRSAQDLKGRTVSHTRRHLTDTEVPHTSPPLQRISVSGDLRSFNCSRARVQPRCAAATPGLVDSRQIRGGEPSETQHHPLARSPLDQAPPCSPARLSVADGGGRQVASLR